MEKAGGFISAKLYEKQYNGIHTESYFGERLTDYFENTEIIYAKTAEVDMKGMELYRKKEMVLGFVRANNVYPLGTKVRVRTLEGDVDLEVTEDLIIMIGIKGEVYPITEEKFNRSYRVLEEKSDLKNTTIQMKYIPMIKDQTNNTVTLITKFAGSCVTTGSSEIYAKQIEKTTKIFTAWDEEKYMLGKAGDYLAVRKEDHHDIYAVEEHIFGMTYEKI